MRGPLIGRADRLAALRRRAAEAAVGLEGAPAVARLLLAGDVAHAAPSSTRRRAVQAIAHELAELLEPLPAALDEVAIRINRHCSVTRRDAELAEAVERLRARTFELWAAIGRLAVAAGERTSGGAGTS
jgi:hypothetical protein